MFDSVESSVISSLKAAIEIGALKLRSCSIFMSNILEKFNVSCLDNGEEGLPYNIHGSV